MFRVEWATVGGYRVVNGSPPRAGTAVTVAKLWPQRARDTESQERYGGTGKEQGVGPSCGA
jgi:hypothetical protein